MLFLRSEIILIIGILGRPKKIERDYFVFSKSINDVIIKYQALAIGIMPLNLDVDADLNKEEIKHFYSLLDICDGLILQGGKNAYNYDKVAINYLNKKDIPILGICLGMQSLALATGGKLEREVLTNHLDLNNPYVHEVKLAKSSLLYKIMKKEIIKVNSRHQDRVIKAGDYEVVGLANDGVIEALEHPLKQFSIGVQWHPESLVEDDIFSQRLFSYFFKTCKGNKIKK